jgi:hypothetical protein
MSTVNTRVAVPANCAFGSFYGSMQNDTGKPSLHAGDAAAASPMKYSKPNMHPLV